MNSVIKLIESWYWTTWSPRNTFRHFKTQSPLADVVLRSIQMTHPKIIYTHLRSRSDLIEFAKQMRIGCDCCWFRHWRPAGYMNIGFWYVFVKPSKYWNNLNHYIDTTYMLSSSCWRMFHHELHWGCHLIYTYADHRSPTKLVSLVESTYIDVCINNFGNIEIKIKIPCSTAYLLTVKCTNTTIDGYVCIRVLNPNSISK